MTNGSRRTTKKTQRKDERIRRREVGEGKREIEMKRKKEGNND